MRGYNTNTPGFPPSFFILPSLAWVYIFVSAGQVLLSAVSRCSASPSVSERVFLMYPWRCTPRPPTPMPSCSLEITTTLLISYAPIQNKNLKKKIYCHKGLTIWPQTTSFGSIWNSIFTGPQNVLYYFHMLNCAPSRASYTRTHQPEVSILSSLSCLNSTSPMKFPLPSLPETLCPSSKCLIFTCLGHKKINIFNCKKIPCNLLL